MHVNVVTLVGRVSPAGPKLSYASSGTPVCSLVVEVDELGPGEKIFTTWLPVRITGKYAEQSSVDLDKAGQHLLYLCGELCRLANGVPVHYMATGTRV